MLQEKKINYITNLDVERAGGGWSGMNHNIYKQLSNYYNINLVQKISPPIPLFYKVVSKFVRFFSIPGIFPAFTTSRLLKIKKAVDKQIDRTAQLDFFHGVTPWLLTPGTRPYALYTDACFATYISVYHKASSFSSSQLELLFKIESAFLEKALAVFFSSRWAMEETKKAYTLEGSNFHVARLGGNLPIPDSFQFNSFENYFLFVGLDFTAKGGLLVAEAFRDVKKKFPDFQLYLVGGKPPREVLEQPGVSYFGYLDKRKPEDLNKLVGLFSKAYCLILPTNRDMTPLVIAEAGYFGCPTIAVKGFGIPEMINDGESGLLVDSPVEATSIASAMLTICSDRDYHQKLRINAFHYLSNSYSWNKTVEFIRNILNNVQSNQNMQTESVSREGDPVRR
jgi:glycosyltransferase involved in cell wall biosynthesis